MRKQVETLIELRDKFPGLSMSIVPDILDTYKVADVGDLRTLGLLEFLSKVMFWHFRRPLFLV